MKIRATLLICSIAFCFHVSHAQTNSQVNTIGELAVAMKLGFENMEKQRQADREYLEKLIKASQEALEKQRQADREYLEKIIQANQEALEKRIAFLENLMIVLFTTVVTQLGYTIWSDRKDRQRTQAKTPPNKVLSENQLEQLLKRIEALEKQQVVG